MANPNDRGFNTIQNSRVARRRKTETLQMYTVLGVIAMAVLTVVILVVMAVGGVVGNQGESGDNPHNEKIEWGSFTVTATDTLQGELVLVNNTHAYTFPATEEHLTGIYAAWDKHTSPRPYMLSGLSTLMDKTALEALDRMLTDFSTATGKTNVQLRYAYRTMEEQSQFDIAAGYSDHHTGLGCSLMYTDENKVARDLSLDPVYNWLFENCYRYGFIVRYPADKTEITGVADYNYYFRYVGIPHATYMASKGLCLEEYVETLKNYDNEKPLQINAADGKVYEAYYVAVDGSATVKHPTNYAYTVSGTNEGGVVITVDRSGKTADTSADTAEQTGAVEP